MALIERFHGTMRERLANLARRIAALEAALWLVG